MEKFKRFLHGENSVKGATVILIVTLLLSNILGLFRDHFLAQKISTNFLDTYYAAFRIPDLILNLLILGALSTAFIPIFAEHLAKKQSKEAWHIANSFINIAFVAIIICMIILWALMPSLIHAMVGSFDTEKQILTIKLGRIMLLSPLFFSLSYIFGGILNSYKRFVAYSIAPIIYNLSIIIFTLLFANAWGVYAPVVGVVVGAFLHMLIQIPTTISLGWRPMWVFDWANASIKKIVKIMVPRTIGLGAMQIMLLVYTAIAATLGGGAVAIFNLADNIQTMPTVVFGISFSTAIFPYLSQTASLGKHDDFARQIWKVARAILFILIPMGVAIILLRAQIVRIILGSGNFGWEQTIETAKTLGYFAIALFAQGLIPLFARAFYAKHNSKTPTIISIVSIIISIALGYYFTQFLGVAGLALAASVGAIFNAIYLYIMLRKDSAQIKNHERAFGSFLFKIIISTILMATIIQLAKYLSEPFVDMQRFWGVFTQFAIASILGIITYLGLSALFKLDEIDQVISLVKKRFKP